ncbi:MAG: DUF3810 domain-containing protein [Chitinophagaceae bacterium]
MPDKSFNFKSTFAKLAISLVLVLLVNCMVAYSPFIEIWYSRGVYPRVGVMLRLLLGWVPISVGDIFYGLLVVGGLVKLFRFLRQLFRRKMTWRLLGMKLVKLATWCCSLYVVFYLFWGLNYYRKGIADQLHLEKKPYNTQELAQLAQALALKASSCRKAITTTQQFAMGRRELFQKSCQAYDSVCKTYPFLQYRHNSVKASLFGRMGNYMGYTGYYNPFSGEAQVNMATPPVVLPAVICHEMAHQLGYATEDEANFVGYLAASYSQDKVFVYSIYLDLYRYAADELYFRDSVQYFQTSTFLDTLVRKDIYDIRMFYLPYRTRMQKVINVVYGQYLKANNQPQGLETYSDVVSLLVAYERKYGKI